MVFLLSETKNYKLYVTNDEEEDTFSWVQKIETVCCPFAQLLASKVKLTADAEPPFCSISASALYSGSSSKGNCPATVLDEGDTFIFDGGNA